MSWDDLDIEPASFLDDLAAYLTRYVAFPSHEAVTAVALWIVHTHCVNAFESTPRLTFISPEKGSGKTRGLEVLALVVPSPIHAVNMSPAALYRLVAEKQPTLLLDEADTYLGLSVAKQHEELRGLINAGHRRNATVYRGEVVGKAVKVVELPAFAACALAGIGDLPDTILDRSVIVPMKRRAPDEHVAPFRERLARPDADELRERISQWADQHFNDLRDAWPVMPAGITDRAEDVWEPLIAIADLAGWGERARTAAVSITKARRDRDPSLGIQLLSDCQRIFAARNVDRLTTEELLEALVALDDSPWSDLRGKPLDARGLARRLKKYEARPADHRFGDEVRKGYRIEAFHDAWTRYLAPVADVADVAHPSEGRETNEGSNVALNTPVLSGSSIPNPEGKPDDDDLSLFPSEEGQQGQHAQHAQHDDWIDEIYDRHADLAEEVA
jgi:hypothetical protein